MTERRLRGPLGMIARFRPPTALVVTIVGAALSAWLIPAVTRQWQDQQRARELKAAMVARIARDTADALVVSSFITNGRFETVRDPARPFRVPMKLFNDLDLNWQRNRQEIEAQLQTYFPETGIVREFRRYSALVRGTYWLITDRDYNRRTTTNRLQKLLPGQRENVAALEDKFHDSLGGDKRREKYFFVSQALLRAQSTVTEDILRADPDGLSTDASDFFHDLLPLFRFGPIVV